MTLCEFCGFDSEADSLVAEGAPCGIDGCPVFHCCYKAWLKHAKKFHKGKSWKDIK